MCFISYESLHLIDIISLIDNSGPKGNVLLIFELHTHRDPDAGGEFVVADSISSPFGHLGQFLLRDVKSDLRYRES
jgi:hypothetical protein